MSQKIKQTNSPVSLLRADEIERTWFLNRKDKQRRGSFILLWLTFHSITTWELTVPCCGSRELALAFWVPSFPMWEAGRNVWLSVRGHFEVRWLSEETSDHRREHGHNPLPHQDLELVCTLICLSLEPERPLTLIKVWNYFIHWPGNFKGKSQEISKETSKSASSPSDDHLAHFNFLSPGWMHIDWAKSFLYLWAVLADVNVCTEENGPLSHQMQIMIPIQQKPSVFHSEQVSRDMKPGECFMMWHCLLKFTLWFVISKKKKSQRPNQSCFERLKIFGRQLSVSRVYTHIQSLPSSINDTDFNNTNHFLICGHWKFLYQKHGWLNLNGLHVVE